MHIPQELIERCKKAERKAQFELYRSCYGWMMQVCLRYQNNEEDAKDLMNQSFLKICDKIDQYNSDIPFEAWIRRITINTAVDQYRKSKANRAHFDVEDLSESYWESKMTDVNMAETEMNAESLRALITALPPISQKVFNLCVLDGYEYGEVAELLETSEATCRWHVHFARKKLQELVKKTFQTTESVII